MGSNVPVKFGEYYLLDKIAVGGMAEIWRAKTIGMEGFERVVAIKCILPSYTQNPEFNAMFVDEARIASTLNHSNIVRITNFGVIDDKYYHEMEFVDGRNMRQVLQKCQSARAGLPIDSSCYIISEILKGLHYAHMKYDPVTNQSLNIIHRDMSPQNIMVSFEGEVKIIDWGIAKAKGKMEETRAGILKGKFGYMSPEQANGDTLDKRTDIFSVSTVFYEMLTGERLFLSDNELNTLKKIQQCNFPPPSRIEPGIDKELESIVLKGLEKDRNKRYQQSIEMHEALVHYLYKHYPSYTCSKLAKYIKDMFSTEILQDRKRIKEIENSMPSYSWTDAREDDRTRISNPLARPSGAEQKTRVPDAWDAGARTVVTSNTSEIGKETGIIADEKTIMTKSSKPSPRSNPEATFFDAGTEYIKKASEPEKERINLDFLTDKKNIITKLALAVLVVVAVFILFGDYLKKDTPGQRLDLDGGRQTVGDIVKQKTPEAVEAGPAQTETEPVTGQDVYQAPEESRPEVPETQPDVNATLYLTSQPAGAFVYLDNKRVGMTPLDLTDLKIGKRYNITLESDGYKKLSRYFTLKKRTSNLSLTLSPVPGFAGTAGYLTLNVAPPVLIYIDGRLVSRFKSLSRFRVSPGEHLVRFRNKKTGIDYSLKIKVG
ncbi:MAG: serine/threonine protein kinase, partial [Oligoflexia bacterium]|nr:serine/threonine protein kinase [Oligoflexia bacterium]